MDIILGCEYSNTVAGEFRAAGHTVWSCDLRPSEGPAEWHHQGDIVEFLNRGRQFDLGIFHPDCTEMAVCGNRFHAGTEGRERAVTWTCDLWRLAKKYCKAVCFENPASVLFPHLRRLGAIVQYIQPHQHGHPETKKTGLALHNLPLIEPTDDVYEYMMTLPPKERHRVWYMSPGEDRGKERSRFYPGFAKAMVRYWGAAC